MNVLFNGGGRNGSAGGGEKDKLPGQPWPGPPVPPSPDGGPRAVEQ
ncbi:hypothetical protein ACIBCM_12560 [Streptomyces sp. NPDC051018]